MAKETKLEEKPGGDKNPCGDDIPAADAKTAKLTERETFRQFMLAVAGRDDANYKTAEKIADDAAALMAAYTKRAAQFKG